MRLTTRCFATALFLALSLAASAQQISGGTPGFQRLFYYGAAVGSGNGADLTEDVIANCAYTVPAGQLANVGDTLHIYAAGTFIGSTDAKTIKLKLGGLLLQSALGSTASQSGWVIDTRVTKIASNSQFVWRAGLTNSTSPFTIPGTVSVADTAAMAITVTGQNTTNSVASSTVCNTLVVDFEH